MTKPRVGFLGVGWIGFHRMEAALATGAIEAVAVCDLSPETRAKALTLAPGAILAETLDALLATGVDGVMIATPSAQHAAQAIQCLNAGAAVFCQKPLGRNGRETWDVVEAARRADRLLSVDFSYRETQGMKQIAELIRSGALGHVFAIDLTFHNAYGPDKAWFYDRVQSGGGCLMDLGIHLVDLALSAMDFPKVDENVSATLFHNGAVMPPKGNETEDYAAAAFCLNGGTSVRLACSWRLSVGQDARIEAAFYGTQGGAVFRNINGSFYDFQAEHTCGRSGETLSMPPDAWGGRAAAAWATTMATRRTFDSRALEFTASAGLLDMLYAAHDRDHAGRGRMPAI